MIILGGIGSLRGVVIGAFVVQYVNLTLLRYLGETVLNDPINAVGDATGIALLSDFSLVNYNYLIFGVVLAIMMIKRPEGLFPVETAKAEMHGIGVAADETQGTADELAFAEEVAVEEGELDLVDDLEHHPRSAAQAAFGADTPPDAIRDRDLPEDTR